MIFEGLNILLILISNLVACSFLYWQKVVLLSPLCFYSSRLLQVFGDPSLPLLMSLCNFGWRVLSVFLSILDPQVFLSILLSHGFQQFNLSPAFGICCPSSMSSSRREAGAGRVLQGVEMIGYWPWLIQSLPKTGVAEGFAETVFVSPRIEF